MIKKIVFLSYLPLTAKTKEDYFMARLQAEGFGVQYLDLWPLFFAEEPQVGKIDDPIVIPIESYRALHSFIQAQDQRTTLYWSMVTFEYRVLKLHRVLTRYGCLMARYGWNQNPTPALCAPRRSLWRKLQSKSLRQIVSAGCFMVRSRWAIWCKHHRSIKGFDLLFCCGRYGYQTIGVGAELDIQQSKVVSINSSDYGTYKRTASNPNRVVEGAYVLFLDEYLPLHPDFALFGLSSVAPEDYYPELNRFFASVEQQMGLPVVIAAHPKALRYKEEDFFEGRAVYFGQTAPLVKEATMVMAHGSTSLGYAAMFDKPAVVLLSQAIKQVMPSYYRSFIFYAETLGITTIRFDEPLQQDFAQTVRANHKAYQQYCYDYLTSPQSEGQQTEDIVVEALKTFDTP